MAERRAERPCAEGAGGEAVLRTEAEKKAGGIHYTPPLLAAYLADEAVAGLRSGAAGKGTLRVLDPACGEGELLKAVVDAVPVALRRRLVLTGFDTDLAAVERARMLLADCGVAAVEIHCADFLSAIAENGTEQQMDLSFGVPRRTRFS